MHPQPVELLAACLFAAAVIHTSLAKPLGRLASRFPRHAGTFHLLGEVEVVFGFWAIVLVAAMAFLVGRSEALAYAVDEGLRSSAATGTRVNFRPNGPIETRASPAFTRARMKSTGC